MPSPFLGMNPYLEDPNRWSSVHNRLIVALADALTPQLLPKYQVDIEKRIYEIIATDDLFIGKADVTVQRNLTPTPSTSSNVAVVTPATQPITVDLPVLEEVREAYLEVKDPSTKEVVTVIEILSPTNKRGEGRAKYEKKPYSVLGSLTHLVEIDLLRMGEHLPILGNPPQTHYRILVSRSNKRPKADLYAFNLPDLIPSFPLPLRPGDVEPEVDLQALLHGVYERSGYDYFIDYNSDTVPPLSESDAAWMDALLREKGLRG
ncbi:MAG TPA: hypothetical protein DCY88_31400 [Cyanobacteria bacterium UBA11372]|nr:hypothetical protein [Cyanobacteria bacterium UBA11372]